MSGAKSLISMRGGDEMSSYLSYSSGFMVPSYELDAVRIAQFQACEQRDGFDTEQSSVDIIA